MKKVFTILAALFCAMSLRAETTYEKVSSIPGQEAYVTNITFDAKTNMLRFTDNYKQGTLYDRKYVILFYEWIESGAHETSIYKVTHNSESSFIYGYPIMGTGNKIAAVSITDIREGGKRVEREVNVVNSKGGAYAVQITNEINRVLDAGKVKLRITVGVQVNENGYYICPETGKGYSEGRDQNCYVNCYTARFSQNDLYWRDPKYAHKPEMVEYGDSVTLSALVKGTGQTTFRLQESSDLKTWKTVQTGTVSGKLMRELYTLSLGTKFAEDGREASYTYRLVLEDNNSHVTDTSSNYMTFDFYYPLIDGENTIYHRPGDVFDFPLPADCEKYTLTSALPTLQEKKASAIRITQPACPVELKRTEPLYAVRFYNADNSILSVCMTKCGADAVAPANPTYKNYVFKGWSRTFTNVHNDLNVYARYDLGENYTFETAYVGHKNERYPMEGFAESATRAMIGDSLTFEASICAKFEMELKCQVADLKDSEGDWSWGSPIYVGTFTAAEAAADWNTPKTFRVTRAVGYDYGYEKMNLAGYAFRFVVYCQGETMYSEPMEWDVYYPITVESQIDAWYDPSLTEYLTVFNNSGDQFNGTSVTIPARSQDTIWVAIEKGAGACMQFARVKKPSYPLSSGEDALDRKFFICPNETETVNVTVKNYAVVFEGAEPTSTYNFSSQGLGVWNNKYYAEVVRCGGAVKKMPADPVREDEIFMGWANKTTGNYADDDYLHVPAISDKYLIFEAQWAEPLYTVTFYVDGKEFYSTDVEHGAAFSSIDCPTPTKASSGATAYTFVGWIPEVSTIEGNITFEAVFEEGQGIERVESQELGAENGKIILDGQLLIIRGEKMYNAAGQRVK